MALQKRPGGAPWIGNTNLTFSDRGADITASTLRDSPLYNAGLDRGDTVLQWDGKSLKSQQELTDLLESHKAGDKIHVRYESRGGRKETDVTLAEAPQLELTPYELAGKELTPEMAAFRDAWLGNKALEPLPNLVKYCPVCKRSWTFEYESCPYDGGMLQITYPKPGDEKRAATPQAPAGGGRGGRGGGGQ